MDGSVKTENGLKQELLVATEACKSAQQQLQAAETKTVQYKKKVQELRRREVDAAEVRPNFTNKDMMTFIHAQQHACPYCCP